MALNAIVSGSTVTQVRDSIYLIDVVMRAEQGQRTSLESIRSLQIPLRNGQGRAATADRHVRIQTGISDRLAPGPGADPDSAGGYGAGRAACHGDAGNSASHRSARCDAAERLSDRNGRIGGRERQGPGIREGGSAAHAAAGADHPDVPVAELPARVAGVERGAAWA